MQLAEPTHAAAGDPWPRPSPSAPLDGFWNTVETAARRSDAALDRHAVEESISVRLATIEPNLRLRRPAKDEMRPVRRALAILRGVAGTLAGQRRPPDTISPG